MAKRSPLESLLNLLELQPLDRDLFLAETTQGEGRLFGGLVAAQAVRAASLTVEQGDLHSLHAYFLRPGAHGVPIRFVVHRIRDGRTFTTRRVVAHQAGEATVTRARLIHNESIQRDGRDDLEQLTAVEIELRNPRHACRDQDARGDRDTR